MSSRTRRRVFSTHGSTARDTHNIGRNRAPLAVEPTDVAKLQAVEHASPTAVQLLGRVFRPPPIPFGMPSGGIP